MAKRVTEEDIIKMNNIYYSCRTYAETARQVGFSATTVKKYIIPDYEPAEASQNFNIELSDLADYIENISTSHLSLLTEEEKDNLKEIWKVTTI